MLQVTKTKIGWVIFDLETEEILKIPQDVKMLNIEDLKSYLDRNGFEYEIL